MAAKFTFIGLSFFSAILTFNVVSVDAAPESYNSNSSSRALGDSLVVDDWVYEKSKITGYRWVKGSVGVPVPHSAIQGGLDAYSTAIYVGRAWHSGNVLPANIIPSTGGAFVSYGGQAHFIREYEFLVPKNFFWKLYSGGNVPTNAVVSGITPSGEALYTGRVLHGGCIVIGKIQPSSGGLLIPFDGQELLFKEYEVLVMEE